MKVRTIDSKDLDASCWSIQFWGKEYCKTCKYDGTKDCGANSGNAKKIREGGTVKARDFAQEKKI